MGENSHNRIWDSLVSDRLPSGRSLGSAGRELKQLRALADYGAAPVRYADAFNAVTRAESLIEALKRIEADERGGTNKVS